jgi:glutamyl-tRNA reductase
MGMNQGHGRLAVIGLDFRTARVEVRERWALDDRALAALRVSALRLVPELVVIRTCNRTDLVTWSSDPEGHLDALARAWSVAVGEDPDDVTPPLHLLQGFAGTRHLLRIAGGLESQILGDIHILGQVRRAYREAQASGSVGSHLHRLLDTAIRAGKRIRRETRLMSGHRSVGSEAARHLLEQLPEGAPRRILVLGAGKVGSHAARALAATPGVQVILLNRTAARAVALASEWGGEAGGLDDLARYLPGAGGVLVATGAPGAWVDHRVLSPRAPGRILPVVDVSMPRNVAPDVALLPGVDLADLDDVHPETAAVEEARQEAIPLAERIIEEEASDFHEWVAASQARAALRPLQEWVVEICRREVGFVAPDNDEVAERAARRIAARVLSRPMMAMRSMRSAGSVSPEEQLLLSQTLQQLFSDVPAPGGTPSDSR